jgi:PQQ-like domain
VRRDVLCFLICLLTFAGAQTDVQPLWQISLDDLPESANSIFYGDTIIYYFQDDQLKVIDLQTGEALWQIDYLLGENSFYTHLPINGDGLIFVPEDETVQALDERTGDVVWTHLFDKSLINLLQITNLEKDVSPKNELVFAQTQDSLLALKAATGDVVWKAPTSEDVKYWNYQILSDEIVAVEWTKGGVGAPAHLISSGIDFLKVESGEKAWAIPCCGANIVYTDGEIIDVANESLEVNTFSITRYALKSGEVLRECPIESGTGFLIYRRYLFPEVFSYSPKGFIADGTSLYIDTSQITNISPTPNSKGFVDIYKFPQCDESPARQSPIESVSDTVERYYMPTLMYADIDLFSWVAGPYKDFFLFEKEGQLYKVPIPAKSFTYLYHNKTDNSVSIAPTFSDIDPPPYENIPGVDGNVAKVELMNNLIVVLLEDSTLKMIDFDSGETVLQAVTNIDLFGTNTVFHRIDDVFIVESYAFENPNHLYQAFRFPPSR